MCASPDQRAEETDEDAIRLARALRHLQPGRDEALASLGLIPSSLPCGMNQARGPHRFREAGRVHQLGEAILSASSITVTPSSTAYRSNGNSKMATPNPSPPGDDLYSGNPATLIATEPWHTGPHAAAVTASIAAHDPAARAGRPPMPPAVVDLHDVPTTAGLHEQWTCTDTTR